MCQKKIIRKVLSHLVLILENLQVLAIYTYTAPCPVEPFEPAARKLMGYATVSHFNLVHVDCHAQAVRQARGREEWDSAMLQNANTR